MVDEEIRRLTLACYLPGFTGPTPPAWLLDGLAAGVGGIVLFGSNLGAGDRVAELTAQLRRAAGRPLVLALDEEGGDVTRLDTVRGSSVPGSAALGHLDDQAATAAVFAEIGARLVEAGVTLDLAPVADVNSDPRNPVIGVRSFSSDAGVAARQVAAAVRGLQSTGVAACVKHFPGHGATSSDSHHEVATITSSRAVLAETELVPFQAAIEAGTRAVMTGHLLVPALDDQLATVSRPITTGLLRDELGFDGAVVTDALEMQAVAGTIGMVPAFVRALIAGADAIETGAQDYPELLDELPRAVQAAVESGALAYERLVDAARRTAALAAPGRPDGPRLSGSERSALAARCLEIGGTLPRLNRPLVVECRPVNGMASGVLPWSLAEPLVSRCPGAEVRQVDGPVPVDELVAAAAGRTLVVVVRDPLRHPWQVSALRVAERAESAVIVDVGWPAELPARVPFVRTRGIAPSLLTAAAEVLAGG